MCPSFRLGRLCNSCGRGTHASIRPTPEPPSHLVASTRLLMRQRPEPLRSVLSRCLYVYALLATIYTLGNLFVSILPYLSPSRSRLLPPPPPRVTFPSTMTVQQAEELLWSNFSLSEHHSLVSWDPVLSRAFPRLMHPSRIVPYYYRATGNFESDDITVTTLISSDRFPVFHNLVQRYKGVLILVICSSTHPRRPLRPNICYNPRLSALPGYPSRSPCHVYVFTGLLNLRRRPPCSHSIPNV